MLTPFQLLKKKQLYKKNSRKQSIPILNTTYNQPLIASDNAYQKTIQQLINDEKDIPLDKNRFNRSCMQYKQNQVESLKNFCQISSKNRSQPKHQKKIKNKAPIKGKALYQYVNYDRKVNQLKDICEVLKSQNLQTKIYPQQVLYIQNLKRNNQSRQQFSTSFDRKLSSKSRNTRKCRDKNYSLSPAHQQIKSNRDICIIAHSNNENLLSIQKYTSEHNNIRKQSTHQLNFIKKNHNLLPSKYYRNSTKSYFYRKTDKNNIFYKTLNPQQSQKQQYCSPPSKCKKYIDNDQFNFDQKYHQTKFIKACLTKRLPIDKYGKIIISNLKIAKPQQNINKIKIKNNMIKEQQQQFKGWNNSCFIDSQQIL